MKNKQRLSKEKEFTDRIAFLHSVAHEFYLENLQLKFDKHVCLIDFRSFGKKGSEEKITR